MLVFVCMFVVVCSMMCVCVCVCVGMEMSPLSMAKGLSPSLTR